MQKELLLHMIRSGFGRIFCSILFLSLLLPPHISSAEDIIKVVMLNSSDDPKPSGQAEKVADFSSGKVFINGRFYTGTLEIIRDSAGLHVIKQLPLEKYIEGVIIPRTQKTWELEALKAQAVISRTNAALYRTKNAGGMYHLSSVQPNLMYTGENNAPLVAHAVRATEGEIITYDGLPIKAFFYFTGREQDKLPAEKMQEALRMSRNGRNYKEILKHYYPGTTIVKQEKLVASSQ